MDPQQGALVAHHSEQACKILKSVVLTEPKAVRKSPPKQVTATKKPVGRQRPVKKAVPLREPVTPKPKARKGRRRYSGVQSVSEFPPLRDVVLQPVSSNVATPPRQNDAVKSLLVFDDLEKLISLLRMRFSHISTPH